MPLIRMDDFDSLPDDPARRWLKLRDLLEQRFEQNGDYSEKPSYSDMVEYAEVLKAAAQELGLGDLEIPSPANMESEFPLLRGKVSAMSARLSLRSIPSSSSKSFVLSKPVKERLLSETDFLKQLVRKEDIAEEKRKKLLSILAEFETEVERETFNYSKAMKTLTLCAAGLVGTTSLLADAPNAIATIVQVIGLQQEAIDEHAERGALPTDPPVPQLPAPPKLLAPPND